VRKDGGGGVGSPPRRRKGGGGAPQGHRGAEPGRGADRGESARGGEPTQAGGRDLQEPGLHRQRQRQRRQLERGPPAARQPPQRVQPAPGRQRQ